MAPEKFTRESFWAELEELGEEEVQTRINTGLYSSANKKRELAQQWLDKLAQERSDAVTREQMDIARDAANSARDAADSARDAADEARKANRIATIAIAIAILSAIIAILF